MHITDPSRTSVRRHLALAVAAWLLAGAVFAGGIGVALAFAYAADLFGAVIAFAATVALFPHCQSWGFRRADAYLGVRDLRRRALVEQTERYVAYNRRRDAGVEREPRATYIGRHAADAGTAHTTALAAVGGAR